MGLALARTYGFYPSGAQVTAIDISPKILEKAAAKTTNKPDIIFELVTMDVSRLTFDAALFDVVIGSFIIMVVPNPLKVLQEVKRVCKPSGELLLLEFTCSDNELVVFRQDLVTPLTYAVYRAYFNRDIVKLVQGSGFKIIRIKEVEDGIAKIIQAVSSE